MKLRTKIDIALLMIVVIPTVGWLTFAFLQTPEFVRFSAAKIQDVGKDGRKMPSHRGIKFEYQAESPSRFSIDGQQFRLLAIENPAEDDRRVKAVEFIESWLKEAAQNAIWFSNWSHALQEDDGAWIVWATALRGGEYHCLNVDLVEAGLVDVDYSEHLEYEFRQPEKGGFGPFVKWRHLLDQAEKHHSEQVSVPK